MIYFNKEFTPNKYFLILFRIIIKHGKFGQVGSLLTYYITQIVRLLCACIVSCEIVTS